MYETAMNLCITKFEEKELCVCVFLFLQNNKDILSLIVIHCNNYE